MKPKSLLLLVYLSVLKEFCSAESALANRQSFIFNRNGICKSDSIDVAFDTGFNYVLSFLGYRFLRVNLKGGEFYKDGNFLVLVKGSQ